MIGSGILAVVFVDRIFRKVLFESAVRKTCLCEKDKMPWEKYDSFNFQPEENHLDLYVAAKNWGRWVRIMRSSLEYSFR